ncbi:hypothetical protein KPATCC21470_1471 [Kitasatospora purpeofusca]
MCLYRNDSQLVPPFPGRPSPYDNPGRPSGTPDRPDRDEPSGP